MILINNHEIKFETFPNGETKVPHEIIIELLNDCIFRPVPVSFKYEDDSDLIKLMFVKKFLDKHHGTAHLTIYYMPYSRMDRIEDDSAFTLKYVSEFINSLNFKKVNVIEPHSDVTTALIDNVEPVFINFDLVYKVMDDINFDMEGDYIMFPDLGAASRYKDMKMNNVIIGHKNRDFKTGEITNLELIGEFEENQRDHCNTKVLLVDDLSSYGGTFVHSAKELYRKGFSEIYLLVAHAENSIFEGALFNHMDTVFTTDSILSKSAYQQNKQYHDQLKVYHLEELLKNE